MRNQQLTSVPIWLRLLVGNRCSCRHVWGSEFGERDCGYRSEPLSSPVCLALPAAARWAPEPLWAEAPSALGGAACRRTPLGLATHPP